mmetsp:Transcript_109833/g.310440  ORF Transcript_109833/g.310440 Transcript_109833/m.310440 type:complete len:225 (+) Transcript_109833:405-1079(+)
MTLLRTDTSAPTWILAAGSLCTRAAAAETPFVGGSGSDMISCPSHRGWPMPFALAWPSWAFVTAAAAPRLETIGIWLASVGGLVHGIVYYVVGGHFLSLSRHRVAGALPLDDAYLAALLSVFDVIEDHGSSLAASGGAETTCMRLAAGPGCVEPPRLGFLCKAASSCVAALWCAALDLYVRAHGGALCAAYVGHAFLVLLLSVHRDPATGSLVVLTANRLTLSW